MSKIKVVLLHEYRTGVRSKWFIISTLLGPVGIAVMIAIPVVMTLLMGDGAIGKVAVIDSTGTIGPLVVASDTSRYVAAGNLSAAELQTKVAAEELQAYVVVPPDVLDSGSLTLYSRGGLGVSFEGRVKADFQPVVVRARLQRAGTDTTVISLVEKEVSLSSLKLTDGGIEKDSSMVSGALGYLAGFAMYMLILLYGTLVMRGVVEEKSNRIIEVLASSVRPYDLLLGKVVGIGLVGLTQVVAWIVLGSLVVVGISSLAGGGFDMQSAALQMSESQQMMGSAPQPFMIGDVAVPAINVGVLLLLVFYFLAGYFIYATMYAAVGSAVDQESDAQSLTLPITLPIILTIMFVGNVVSAPNSVTSVILSLIPIFTPILMTVRVAATDVPWWQVSLSVILCIGTFMGAVWVAARIYRIGILSYGKKPSMKQIVRWLFVR